MSDKRSFEDSITLGVKIPIKQAINELMRYDNISENDVKNWYGLQDKKITHVKFLKTITSGYSAIVIDKYGDGLLTQKAGGQLFDTLYGNKISRCG